jgi:hypothetical protein
MREINAAYHLILEGEVSPSSSTVDPSRPPPHAHPQATEGRLSREEIERMVQAVGNDGPFDSVLNAFRVVCAVAFGVYVVVLGIRLVGALYRRDWAAISANPRMAIYPGVGAALLLVWLLVRSQPTDDQ